ncbi:5-formyltetrahydrofolate cyclo-ligase [soil metagenome]
MSEGQRAKDELRKTILARREAMDADTRDALSFAIFEEILHLDRYQRAGVVLAYVGFGSELRTDAFVRRVLDDGKVLLLPRVNREERRLNLYEVKDPIRHLKAGTWGIREPNPERCPRAEADSIDFALVPGVAFDGRGARLGYGGGFYDKLLAGCSEPRPSLVAAAFELQVVDEVPLEEHDVRVDLIVTEGGKYAANLPE